LVSALAMWPCGRFADRFGERVSIALGMLIASADMLIIILTRSPALFALGFAIFGVAQALIGPAFSGLISKAVPQGSLGITWGVFMTALGILAIPAPTIGGLLYDHIAPEAVFVVSAACTVLAVPLVLLKLRVPAQAGDETVAVESVTEKEAIPVA
jgi:MFS family permease